MRKLLKARHGVDSVDTAELLRYLESKRTTYSICDGADNGCYPTKLPKNTNYWYLTDDGWVPWSVMEFTKRRAELGVYKVVTSYSSGPLAEKEPSFLNFARPIWSAYLSTPELEAEAIGPPTGRPLLMAGRAPRRVFTK